MLSNFAFTSANEFNGSWIGNQVRLLNSPPLKKFDNCEATLAITVTKDQLTISNPMVACSGFTWSSPTLSMDITNGKLEHPGGAAYGTISDTYIEIHARLLMQDGTIIESLSTLSLEDKLITIHYEVEHKNIITHIDGALEQVN